MPNLCCSPLPFHWMWVYNHRAGLSGTQRTHIFPMPAMSNCRWAKRWAGVFPSLWPTNLALCQLQLPGPRMLDSEQPIHPREGFCTRFNWLSRTVFQRSGQRSAYVASSLHRFTPSNVCLKKKKKKKSVAKLRDGWNCLYISVTESQMCLKQQLYYLKSPFLQLQWI